MQLPFLLTEDDLSSEVLEERRRCFNIVKGLVDEERKREFEKGATEQQKDNYAEAVMMLSCAAVHIQGLGITEIHKRMAKCPVS